MTHFQKEFPFSRPKILMTYFLVIDQVFVIFPFIFQILRIFTVLNVVYDPFFIRKNTISEKNSLTTPYLLCSYFRAHPTTHYFSKYWWRTDAWAVPPTSTFFFGAPQFPSKSLPLIWTTHLT